MDKLELDDKDICLNPLPLQSPSSSYSKPAGEKMDDKGHGQGRGEEAKVHSELGSECAAGGLSHPIPGSSKEGKSVSGQGTGRQSQSESFPTLVWIKIMAKLNDSKDIQNLLQVFPELEDDYLLENKYSWLMDQVIPFVHPWLSFPQLLSCRGVSQRWCYAVDNYLENHPDRRAYDPDRQITGQIWFPEASAAYSQVAELPWSYFRDEMRSSHAHAGKNPLVGRSLVLSYVGNPSRGGVDANWNKAMDFLHCFGKHVWFLEIQFGNTCSLNLCKILVDVLHLVPNLKSLTVQAESILHFTNSTKEIKKLLGSRWESLPPLDQLETLKYPFSWEALPEALSSALLGRYSPQIRRLHMHLYNWRSSEYSIHFPKLNEFVFPSWDQHRCEKKMIDDVLHSLKTASNLSALNVVVRYDNREKDLGWGDVVSWLTPFPMMETVHLILKEETNWGPAVETNRTVGGNIPSMKSLFIEQHGCDWIKFNLSLLSSFPSLEYLNISYTLDPDVQIDVETEGMILDIFSKLPKLKEVTLEYFRLGEPRTFRSRYVTRGRYEWMERKKAQKLSDLELEAAFACFLAMTLGVWRKEPGQG